MRNEEIWVEAVYIIYRPIKILIYSHCSEENRKNGRGAKPLVLASLAPLVIMSYLKDLSEAILKLL